MPTYYTYKNQVKLGAGETLGFESGRGYYAIPAPKKAAPPPPPPRVAPPPPSTPSTVYVHSPGANPASAAAYTAAVRAATPPTYTYGPETKTPIQANPYTGAPTSGTAGGGRGDDPLADVDWAQIYFGSWNLPSSLLATITQLGKKYGSSNPDVFYQAALNAIRSDPWYQQTFPGIDKGIKAGLFTDETGYRNYVNNVNQAFKQYTGRDVTGDEVASYLGAGLDPGTIGKQFAGDAVAKVNSPDWQYLAGAFTSEGRLSDQEISAFGREQVGLDTLLGQQVAKRISLATDRLKNIFGGQLATPSLKLGANGLQAGSLLGNKQTPDVSA